MKNKILSQKRSILEDTLGKRNCVMFLLKQVSDDY